MTNLIAQGQGAGGAGGFSKLTNPALGPNLQSLFAFQDPGVSFFQKFFPAAIGIGLVIGIILFLFMMITGAIQWILSGGDKTQTEAARNQVTAALVGLVIVFSAWAIVRLIGTFFDVKILEGDLKLPSVPQE